MTKTIAIIEPCFFGVGYVEAAYARGYKIIAIVSSIENPKKYGYDKMYSDLIVADIRDSDLIIKAIESYPNKNKIDAILPGCSYVGEIGAVVADHFGFINVGVEAAMNGRFKDRARTAFDNAKIPNARFATVTNFDEAVGVVEKIGYPLIVKPTNCDCSQNVVLIKDEGALKKTFGDLQNFTTSYLDFKVRRLFLLEEYIDGPEFSVELFLLDGKPIFSSVTEKNTTPPPYFTELTHVVPTSVYKDKVGMLTDAAVNAQNAIGMYNGPSHVELRISLRGPIVMEINPRPAGGRIAQDLLINAYGVNIFEVGLDFFLGQRPVINKTKNMASALTNLIVKKPGKVKKIAGLDNVDKMPFIVKKLIKVKPGDVVYPPTNNDNRYGYIISAAPTPEAAKQAVLDAINCIRIEYEDA